MLPEDIIIDIHTRLPIESIGRSRCVSKSWRSFLSESKFIKDHLTRNKQYRVEESLIVVSVDSHCLYSIPMYSVFHWYDELYISAFKLNFAVHPDFWVEDIPSCDGLILIRDSNDTRVLINPTTREFRALPTSPYALDPCASFTMYALGYDSVSDDYKVVAISYYDAENENESDSTQMFVNVYSVRYGAWKKVESLPNNHAGDYIRSGVFVSGCIHWLDGQAEDNSPIIVKFDLAEDKLSEMRPPGSVEGETYWSHRLMVLGGRLCFFLLKNSFKSDIWVMMDYGVHESWVKFTINSVKEAEFRPLCMSGQDEMLIVKDEETESEKLVMYNLGKKTFKDIFFGADGITEEYRVGGTYIETIVSPFYNNEQLNC